MRFTLAIMAFIFMAFSADAQSQVAQQLPQGAPTVSGLNPLVESQITTLISKMTLNEKIQMVSGDDPQTHAIKRLGIPSIVMNDAGLGLRIGAQTAFPAGPSLGASFDPELSGEMGAAIADEARIMGVNMLLGPCVNIHRTPWGGRNFESYGEDPYLATQMVAPYIIEMQKHGVMSTVKHFAVNDEEWNRHTADVRIDLRTLNEIHLPAFKAAVDAGVWSVMGAYNLVNGQHATENTYLLTTTLKQAWGFTGFVVSDWSGTVSTVGAANAGLDLEMPTGIYLGKLASAISSGEVKMSTLDDKVRRLLRSMFAMGLMDKSIQATLPAPKGPASDEHRQLAQKIAEEGTVLLKNEGILPLASSVKSIAVIGPSAAVLRTGGGGSSHVNPFEAVSPLDALRSRLASKPGDKVKINFARGAEIDNDIWPSIVPMYVAGGFKAEYFKSTSLKGSPFMTRQEPSIMLDLAGDVGADTFGVRWSGTLLAPASGTYKFSTSNFHTSKVYINDKLILQSQEWSDGLVDEASINLVAGQSYQIRVETSHADDDSSMPFQFGWDIPNPNLLAEAVAAAKDSDVAILFVGMGNDLESEGADRDQLTLPDDQVALIEAVAKVNPNVVVVMNSGSVSLMRPWLDQVKAVMQSWYPGEEGGWALARLLLGDVSPSGKLPESSLKRWEDSSSYGTYPGDPKTLQISYKEGVFVGYRYLDQRGIAPEYPFGFGLSYTTFTINNLRVNATDVRTASPNVRVTVDVTNTGDREGAEVVQAYVGELKPSVPRPPRELKAFARVMIAPHQTQSVTLTLNRSSFAFWDIVSANWKVNPNAFNISVGSSSRDLPVTAVVQLQ